MSKHNQSSRSHAPAWERNCGTLLRPRSNRKLGDWLALLSTPERRGNAFPRRSVGTRVKVALPYFLAIFLFIPALQAAEPPKAERAPREIFVPFNDLNVLLEQQPSRVLLSREEYDELLKKAKKTPAEHAPHEALIVSADYNAKLTQQRAEIRVTT